MGFAAAAAAEEYLSGIQWQRPPVVDPGKTDDAPPSDAVVLFDGTNLDAWKNGENWEVRDGVAYSGKGQIVSKEVFGDCQVHIEWSAPLPVKGSGQGRGNSGVFLMGRYEIQVLDSYDNETYYDGQAGAIYKQTPPQVNAMRKPGQWNTYDIIWTAPRFAEDGSLESPAYITALHNGVVILNHFQLKGDTPYNRPPEYRQHAAEGPLALQDHGNPVRFRNIWVRPLKPAQGEQQRPPYIRDGDKETPVE
ncbi:3-keto-disaccharide hydrolase [Roseimaritima sediminicola]|uniref:3-keto-disaccharide hydrolase n=1 Tax=Roseimaritima sediminicola TaxID=2662066 RepID=UPI0012983F2B